MRREVVCRVRSKERGRRRRARSFGVGTFGVALDQVEARRERRARRGRMIQRDFVTEWRGQAPWVQDVQVEQDLVISRALVSGTQPKASRGRWEG